MEPMEPTFLHNEQIAAIMQEEKRVTAIMQEERQTLLKSLDIILTHNKELSHDYQTRTLLVGIFTQTLQAIDKQIANL